MIAIPRYNKNFEEYYYKIVEKKVDYQLQNDIIKSCKKYFPEKYFEGKKNNFKTLVLLPYKELKEIYNYIKENTYSHMEEECFEKIEGKEELKAIYKKIHDLYEKVANSCRGGVKTNVRIVKESKISTCPYCNRDYINCRGNNVSGGQLDHFYNRSKYPIFSICLYNLVPVCGNCNRVKSNVDDDIISPFDESIDFNSSLYFDYEFDNNGQIVLDIVGDNGLENNIKIMKIKQAYEMHNIDVKELVEKAEIYNKTQTEEIIETFSELKVSLSSAEFKELIFGRTLKPERFGKKPLSKLKYNILKKLDII